MMMMQRMVHKNYCASANERFLNFIFPKSTVMIRGGSESLLFVNENTRYYLPTPFVCLRELLQQPSMTIIDQRALLFHSSAIQLAPKKRRISASSARKKKQREIVKQQRAKQRAISNRGEGNNTKLKMASQPNQLQLQQMKQIMGGDSQKQQQLHNTDIPDAIHSSGREEMPRAFLTRTASPNVYIAKCAVMNESTGEMYIDPKALFSETALHRRKKINTNTPSNKSSSPTSNTKFYLPQIFRNSHLQYFPPSSFPNYEPPSDGRTPEVAFLGRSNTGKSSLINALSSTIIHTYKTASSTTTTTNTTTTPTTGELARTSKTPGRTQTINYFGLITNTVQLSSSLSSLAKKSNTTMKNNSAGATSKIVSPKQSKLYLIDLPGYGYASAPEELIEEWQRKTQEFLISRAFTTMNNTSLSSSSSSHHNRWNTTSSSSSSPPPPPPPPPPLKRLYLLLDSRLSQPTLLDLTVMGWCDEYEIPYSVVLTKVDGTSSSSCRSQCVKLTNQLCMRYHSLYHTTSAAAAEDEDEDEDDIVVEPTNRNTTTNGNTTSTTTTNGNRSGRMVYMDPVVYWTSSKEGLGMEELLMSIANNISFSPQ